MNGEAFYRDLLLNASESFPVYPEGRYRGKGIVLCAGGLKHLSNAYVCMKFLREFTDLPIELFYAGEKEMPEAVRERLRKEFAPLELKDITRPGFRKAYPFLRIDHFRGFQIKPYALLHASFEEIFYIDADNLPLRSPEPLFASEEYARTGALFWPDLERTRCTTDVLFRVFGVPEPLWRDDEVESGQIVIDKRRCWKALLAACLANSDVGDFRTFCYRNTLGDKDLFRLACEQARQPYHLIPHPSLRVGNNFIIIPIPLTDLVIKIQHDLGSFYATGMLQHDLAGKPLFVHKTVCEWDCYVDFRSLLHCEERNGKTHPLPLLAELETRGYRHLEGFKESYLPAFGTHGFDRFRGLSARVIVKILDGLSYLQRGS